MQWTNASDVAFVVVVVHLCRTCSGFRVRVIFNRLGVARPQPRLHPSPSLFSFRGVGWGGIATTETEREREGGGKLH